MSRKEYLSQECNVKLTDEEAVEQQEILKDVTDLNSLESIETATALRVAREIKKCAQEEVQKYLDSEEFRGMVEVCRCYCLPVPLCAVDV